MYLSSAKNIGSLKKRSNLHMTKENMNYDGIAPSNLNTTQKLNISGKEQPATNSMSNMDPMKKSNRDAIELPNESTGNENATIFAELKEDHKEIKRLCKELCEAEDRSLPMVAHDFERLRVLVTAHAKAEERKFYAELLNKASADEDTELKDLVMEGYEEHHIADVLLHELAALSPTDDQWLAKMTVLKESLDHHIKEEEGDIFKLAKKVIASDEALEIGANFLNKEKVIAKQESTHS
jgi:hypothetical protein